MLFCEPPSLVPTHLQSGSFQRQNTSRMPSSLGNLKLDTPVVARQPTVKHLHGYAREQVLLRCMAAWQPWSNSYMDTLVTKVLLRTC
jgi:hypothetical protein